MKDDNSDLTGRFRYALAAWAGFLFCIFLLVTNGPAWSFETNQLAPDLQPVEKAGSFVTTLPPVTGREDEGCEALLNTANYDLTTRGDEMDRRSVKRDVAAIGVIFGVRFALGPKEIARSGRKPAAKLDIWEPNNGHGAQVLAVSAYRDCKKEKALKALNDFRWQR